MYKGLNEFLVTIYIVVCMYNIYNYIYIVLYFSSIKLLPGCQNWTGLEVILQAILKKNVTVP